MPDFDHDWRWKDGSDRCTHCNRVRNLRPSEDRKPCRAAVAAHVKTIDFGPGRCSLCGSRDNLTRCSTVGCPVEHQGG